MVGRGVLQKKAYCEIFSNSATNLSVYFWKHLEDAF